MSQPNAIDPRLAGLQHLLDVYGADRARWPAAERLRLAGFISSDPGAKAALAEAQALDRLLDLAPRVSVERERALARRILAAVGESQQRAAAPVSLHRPAPRRASVARWAAPALMAASLVVGVFVGSTGALQPTVTYLAEISGLADDESELALATDVLHNGEEAL
jgi:hypothetical protein